MDSGTKQTFIRDISAGTPVADLFLVSAMTLAETKAGKPYLALTVMDKTGELQARVWDNAERFADLAKPGNIVRLRGTGQSFRDVVQLKVDYIAAPAEDEAVDLADFLPSTAYDVEEMTAEFFTILRSVKDDILKPLLLKIYRDRDFLPLFQRAPAAKKMHHAYLGGLLEHTLSVTRLALRMVEHYPGVDRDLLVAGAALHDVGKVREFRFDTLPYDYTDVGRLVGHLVLGSEMVRRAAGRKNERSPRVDQLVHLILSHHGRYEYGSPCLPMTLEAMLLNFIDDMDSKVNYIENLSKTVSGSGYQWSSYQRPLERFLLLRPTDDESPGTHRRRAGRAVAPDDTQSRAAAKKQQRLF